MANWKPLTNLEMVKVPEGCFQMGCGELDDQCFSSEKPIHNVCLVSAEIGKYEITQSQWKKIMGYNPSFFKKDGAFPIENVSWNDIKNFIRRLNRISDKNFRLPTEAEWEYAARAGTETAFSFGDEISKLGEYAWYSGNSEGKTHLVGQKEPNAWGLYDMHGNVWEWVEDDWHDNYDGAPSDGGAWIDDPRGAFRVFRGGSWHLDARNCRSATRDFDGPGLRFNGVGFRLARSVTLGP
jgi:formylglycine-generating enzyme required for sulfatase activity